MSEDVVPAVVYPPVEELFFWWRCYRKIGYASETLANIAAAEYESTVSYSCPYGDHWHNGKPRHPGSVHKSNPSAHRKMWRKTQVKPSLTELHEAYLARTPRVLVTP